MNLSEFKGQEHVTSILRAMVIKKTVRPFIAFGGSSELAANITFAFSRALNCEQPVKGDACGNCASCLDAYSNALFTGPVLPQPGKWLVQIVDTGSEPLQQDHVIFVKFGYADKYLNFTLKEPGSTFLDRDLIRLVIYAMCGELKEVLPLSASVAERMSRSEFLTGLTEVFKSFIYVKNNLEIAEVENLDLVRKSAVGIHQYHVNAAIRLLWDSQERSQLPDDLAIQTVSVLLSELLHPTPQPTYTDFMSYESDKPIITVEDTTGQPLDIDKMLEIAHE